MACCGLHQVRFQKVDDETPDFSAELASFPAGRCRRHVSLKGRSPVKVPLCAEDAAVTEDEGLFDEKGYLVGLCPGHAAMVISQAVEGRACTGDACSGLDEESGLSKAMPRCGTKFVGKRLYCDQCYEVRVATGVTPAKPVRTLVLDDGSLDHAPGSASSGVSAITMSASGSPGAGIRGGVFGAALSRAGRVLSAVGGDVALHEAVSASKVARSPSENDDATTLPDVGGPCANNLGVELDIAALKELMAASAARQEAVVARQAAESDRLRADLGDVRVTLDQVADTLHHFSERLGDAERKAASRPTVEITSSSPVRGDSAGQGMKDVDEARSIATEVIDGLRGPDLSDDPSLPPLRRLEHAISEVSKADREVSPSKRELQDKARVLKSEVTAENERIDCLVAAEGAELVRRFGTDGAAEKIAEALDITSVEPVATMLRLRFPPKFGEDDDAVKLEFDEASAEESSDHCSEQSDPEPEPEVVQYVHANGSREPAHLVSESADGMFLIKLLSSGKGKRAPPSRVVRDDVKLGADGDSDGNCSDASEVALVRVGYMRADGSVEPAEIVKTYPDGLHRVRLLSSGKEKRGVTEARLVRGEMRGGGASAPSSPLRRPVGPRGGARGASVASSARTSSSVAAAEIDFPSIYSQFGGDEVSVSDVKQPGRWPSSAALSFASDSVGQDDFATLGHSLGRVGGEPSGSVRRRVLDEALRSLNDGTAHSFGGAFESFEEGRPGWRQDLANAPPRTAAGAHVFDVSPSEVSEVSARSSAISRGMRRMDVDFQGAARLGESSLDEEAPGEMPLGTLDRAEMERELSRAKLTFDDDNAQKELVMPVLPSATRLSHIKDFDEAIFWTLRGGLDPSYAPEFMPGLSATQMATEIFNAIHEAAIEGKPYPFPVEMNDFVVLAICTGSLGAEVFEPGSQSEQRGGARLFYHTGRTLVLPDLVLREDIDPDWATQTKARSNHVWSSSDVPRPRVRIGNYVKETDLINRIDAMADLVSMLYNTGWGREIKLAAIGFKRLAEERINNFRSYPLEVLAVTFEKLMHHFIYRVRGQCRKLIMGIERSRKSTRRPHIFGHLRIAMMGRDEHRSRLFEWPVSFRDVLSERSVLREELQTSKPTEGEVPPAGCAGVVCANETNKKKTKWRAFSLLRIAEERARRGGGGRGNIQHAARTQQP